MHTPWHQWKEINMGKFCVHIDCPTYSRKTVCTMNVLFLSCFLCFEIEIRLKQLECEGYSN